MKTLVWHFFSRFFDNEIVSREGDMRTTVVEVLGLLAAPGLLASMYLMPGFTSIDRYFFVAYSMVVMGFVMVFEWDMLFPDLRDYLILMSLPITLGKLFLTKLAALCLFLGVFILDINVFAIVLMPLITCRGGTLDLVRLCAAHSAAVLGGGLFMALAFGALQGVLINLLSTRVFRRISPLIQMGAMALLVIVLFMAPLVARIAGPLLRDENPAVYFFPPLWFLGLYQVLSPSGAPYPVYAALAALALKGLAAAALLFAFTYLAGYRRHCRRVLESVETSFAGPAPLIRRLSALLNRFALRHPVERAAFYFTGQTVARSSRHRLFLAGYSAAGLALAALDIFQITPLYGVVRVQISHAGLVALPLTLSFFLISGLRAAFNFPAELRANWVFQITESDDRARHLAGTRKWVVLCGILPLFLVLAPLQSYAQLLFAVTLCLLMMSLLFYNFRKVPFTCSYLPSKRSMAGLGAIYLFGYTTYSYTMSALELSLARRPALMVLFYLAAFALIWFSSRQRDRDLGRGFLLSWEESPDPIVRELHLT